jgi:hypothetical protein
MLRDLQVVAKNRNDVYPYHVCTVKDGFASVKVVPTFVGLVQVIYPNFCVPNVSLPIPVSAHPGS